jgi:uncharacterized protein
MIEDLVAAIRAYERPRAVVAFSGGVDSSVVLALAARALGPAAVEAVTAISPSYPAGELERAGRTAAQIGARHRVVETHEVERDAYARNDAMRCFHCKVELYTVLGQIARAASPDAVVLAGANADDVAEFRPGLQAAGRHGVRNPLLELGLGKAEVRSTARILGLAVADKPALACLSSRVAYGIRISPELLARIDRAEAIVRALGFETVRVRHLGEAASVEVDAMEVDRLVVHPGWPGARLRIERLGWREVSIDRAGYRSGSLNALLPLTAKH